MSYKNKEFYEFKTKFGMITGELVSSSGKYVTLQIVVPGFGRYSFKKEHKEVKRVKEW